MRHRGATDGWRAATAVPHLGASKSSLWSRRRCRAESAFAFSVEKPLGGGDVEIEHGRSAVPGVLVGVAPLRLDW